MQEAQSTLTSRMHNNMNTSCLNTLRTLLALCVATAVSPVIGQTLPPPYPETFPLGTLTISCTIYTNGSAKSSYTTKDLLNDLGRDLGVTFPAGSYLQVMTTPYQGYYDSFGGIFPVASTGLTVVARSKNGQSWDVSSYIQLGMDTTYSSGFPIGPGYLMSGSVGPSPESPTDVTAAASP